MSAMGVIAHAPGEDLLSAFKHCGEDFTVLQDFTFDGRVKRLR